MADVNTRLVGPKQLASSATTEYTVPGATTTVIRFMHFSNPTSSDKTVTWSIGADDAGTRLMDAFTIPANSIFPYPCHITMEAGEILQMSASAATSVNATVDGIETT